LSGESYSIQAQRLVSVVQLAVSCCDIEFYKAGKLAKHSLVVEAHIKTTLTNNLLQIQQAVSAYKNLCLNHDPSRIVLSGDSAGGTLVLSLLLHIATENANDSTRSNRWRMSPPGMAVLISPWVTLVSPKDKNTASDYLDAAHLHYYARQYAGSKIAVHDPLISPGDCKDLDLWAKASPAKGFFICYGSEEVFAPEIRDLVQLLELGDVEVDTREEKGGVHVWPVTAIFLSSKLAHGADYRVARRKDT